MPLYPPASSGGGQDLFGACGARLSLTSNTPVTSGDVLAALVAYLVPLAEGGAGLLGIPTGVAGAYTMLQLAAQLSIKATDTAQTGNFGSGVTTITGLTDTSKLVRGMQVTGTNIAASSVIATIPSATSITVNNATTGTGSATALTFKLVPSTTNQTGFSLYDVFAVDVSGAAALRYSNKWTNGTTRADAVAYNSDGVRVNTNAINSGDSNSIAAGVGLYVGTVQAQTTAGQLEDSVTWRGVWNQFNPRRRLLLKSLSGTYSYTGVARQFDGDTANQINLVSGFPDQPFDVSLFGQGANPSGVLGLAGIGLDAAAGLDAYVFGTNYTSTPSHDYGASVQQAYAGQTGAHFVALTQSASGGTGVVYVAKISALVMM